MTNIRTAHIAALGFLLACVFCSAALTGAAFASTPSTHCAEDNACWSWSTMGNRARGITLYDGTTMVVGRCQFASAVVGRTLTLRGDNIMRGDLHAIRHPGCDTGATLRERLRAYRAVRGL